MDFPDPLPEGQASRLPASAEGQPLAILELQQQSQDLKRLFNATFVALIALALGVNLFMAKVVRVVTRDLQANRPVWLEEIEQFRKRDEPEIRKFMAELQLYAASHRDFQTNILDRYRAAMPQYYSVPAVVSGPRDHNLPAPRPPGQ